MPTVTLNVSAHELNAGDVFEAITGAAKVGLDRKADRVMLSFNNQNISVDPHAPWSACGRWLHDRLCGYIQEAMDETSKLEARLDKLEARRSTRR